MCGIAGIINFQKKVEKNDLIKMTNAIKHRGPDGEGHWINNNGNVGFGHRRLSIIDLSDDGHQPMNYSNNRYTITYNGEVYNYLELKKILEQKKYKFNSKTDTEVILAAYDYWGKDCVKKFDGMFAFAIWDELKKELFCARDRFGEKPFYYFKEKDYFVFASEMKALWALGIHKSFDSNMTYNFVNFGYEYNPNDLGMTFYKNVRSLPPSNYIIYKESTKQIYTFQYFSLEEIGYNYDLTVEQLQIKLKDLITESISLRLRSDVIVGSSLSGGIDSNVIVHTISKLSEKQRTYSAVFKGFKKNEEYYIDLTANKLNIKPKKIDLSNFNYSEILKTVINNIEEPFFSPSILAQYKVMELAKKDGTKVLLDGQGADETLCGYHSFFNIYFNELFNKNINEFTKEYKNYKNLQRENTFNTFRKQSLFKLFLKHKIGVKRNNSNENLDTKFNYNTNFTTVNEECIYLLTKGPLQSLLKYSDRNSMYNHVEVRLPFLSHKLIEFILTIPPEYRIKSGWTKWILRQTFAHEIPNEIVWNEKKVGYEPPSENKLFFSREHFLKKHYGLQ